jgi:hypothetical protein
MFILTLLVHQLVVYMVRHSHDSPLQLLEIQDSLADLPLLLLVHKIEAIHVHAEIVLPQPNDLIDVSEEIIRRNPGRGHDFYSTNIDFHLNLTIISAETQ